MWHNIDNRIKSKISKEYLNFDEWVESLSDNDLNYYTECIDKDTLSDENFEEFLELILCLYEREMNKEDIFLSDNVLYELFNIFSTNILIASLRRKGLIETSEPLKLYNNTKLTSTKKGTEIINILKEI